MKKIKTVSIIFVFLTIITTYCFAISKIYLLRCNQPFDPSKIGGCVLWLRSDIGVTIQSELDYYPQWSGEIWEAYPNENKFYVKRGGSTNLIENQIRPGDVIGFGTGWNASEYNNTRWSVTDVYYFSEDDELILVAVVAESMGGFPSATLTLSASNQAKLYGNFINRWVDQKNGYSFERHVIPTCPYLYPTYVSEEIPYVYFRKQDQLGFDHATWALHYDNFTYLNGNAGFIYTVFKITGTDARSATPFGVMMPLEQSLTPSACLSTWFRTPPYFSFRNPISERVSEIVAQRNVWYFYGVAYDSSFMNITFYVNNDIWHGYGTGVPIYGGTIASIGSHGLGLISNSVCIAEIGAFNRQLSLSEIEAIKHYANRKYNLW